MSYPWPSCPQCRAPVFIDMPEERPFIVAGEPIRHEDCEFSARMRVALDTAKREVAALNEHFKMSACPMREER